MNTLADIVNIIEAEGFRGAHSLVFLIKYAHLADDRKLMDLIVNTMESMNSLPESPMLLKAYKELYKATGKCYEIVDFLSGREANISKGDMPWDLLDKYEDTYEEEYLEKAIEGGRFIIEHFHEMFDPNEVYDLSTPSFNSQVAVLYDALARYTQDAVFLEARENQNKFIRLLADKYPTKVTYGLIALLSEEFGETTVVCEGEIPESVKNFYAPTTAIVFKKSDEKKIGIMKDGSINPLMIQ